MKNIGVRQTQVKKVKNIMSIIIDKTADFEYNMKQKG